VFSSTRGHAVSREGGSVSMRASSRLPGHLPGNCKVPGSMPSWGFLLLLFPWTRNFTPIVSVTQLLNREHTYCIVCNQGTAEKQLSIPDVVIPVEKSQKKKRKKEKNLQGLFIVLFESVIFHRHVVETTV